MRLSLHPAPDNLTAHVDVVVTTFMYSHQVVGFPIIVVAIFVV
ncbi:hypothetical protein [Floridanema evergladense]|uniref:Uncharacterized protein n=1 Tax=Floridaenema evergladense BLCC-F167 TaxID=3153639 RepID=A0ABV4WE92_9CYAN